LGESLSSEACERDDTENKNMTRTTNGKILVIAFLSCFSKLFTHISLLA
jgi:hypothetical protein